MGRIAIFSVFILICGHLAWGEALRNKSLSVGDKEHPNRFGICVAKEVLRQTLPNSHSFIQLSSSFIDYGHAPVHKATLVFVGKYLNTSLVSYIQVVMKSLDPQRGWVSESGSGLREPFSSLVSDRAVALQDTGVVLGEVDLAACREE